MSGKERRLPQDLEIQILLWLPVVQLLRFKSVCKLWYSLIQNPAFINQHCNHPRNDQENLLVVYNPYSRCCSDSGRHNIRLHSGHNNNFRRLERFELPSFGFEVEVQVNTSYNGVICLQNGPYFSLYNPTLKEFRILPEPPALKVAKELGYYGGFGFDFINNDYKVVRVFVQEQEKLRSEQVDVYSLSSNCWRSIDAAVPVSLTICRDFRFKTPVCNGRYCWWSTMEGKNLQKSKILTFDFSKEVFGTIPLPDVFAHHQLELTLFDGNIACIESRMMDNVSLFDVWLLKEYGVEESWTKLYTLRMGFSSTQPSTHPFIFLNNRDIICLQGVDYMVDEWKLYLWDHVTRELKDFLNQVCPHIFFDQVALYKESLLSIKPTRALDATKL